MFKSNKLFIKIGLFAAIATAGPVLAQTQEERKEVIAAVRQEQYQVAAEIVLAVNDREGKDAMVRLLIEVQDLGKKQFDRLLQTMIAILRERMSDAEVSILEKMKARQKAEEIAAAKSLLAARRGVDQGVSLAMIARPGTGAPAAGDNPFAGMGAFAMTGGESMDSISSTPARPAATPALAPAPYR